MGSAKHERMGALKECSVRVMDDSYEVKDVLKSIINDIGNGKILSCVKSSGNWIITLRNKDDADLLIETGIVINDSTCNVYGVSRSFLTVSLFGVPSYIDDDELSEKLLEFGCKLKGKWHHNTYPEFPNIENGIRYIRLELPTECKSLPYAMTLNGVHMRLKHNGQTRVCNLCLENDHIMRNCPKYVCRECNSQGHWEAKCPQVRCFKCNDLGHKSFNCPQAGDDNNDHHGNGDPATGRNTISPPKHANVQHTDQPKDEAMDQLSQTKGSAIETNETKKKQNENIKTTQRDEQRPTKPTQEDTENTKATRGNKATEATNSTGNKTTSEEPTTELPQQLKRQMSYDEGEFRTVRLKKKSFIPNLRKARNSQPR